MQSGSLLILRLSMFALGDKEKERKGKPYVRAKDKAEMREEDDNTGKEGKQYNERSKIGM